MAEECGKPAMMARTRDRRNTTVCAGPEDAASAQDRRSLLATKCNLLSVPRAANRQYPLDPEDRQPSLPVIISPRFLLPPSMGLRITTRLPSAMPAEWAAASDRESQWRLVRRRG
jgi:hypothetical protein